MSDYINEETREEASERDLLEWFDEGLDEMDGPIKVAGIEFDASRILKELDPIAYRCHFLDWLDGEGWREPGELDDEDED